jgi:general secretion pathway protein H
MPTWATGNSRARPDAGFTLVEAMTTLMIVGLLAGMVVLVSPGPERKSREAAERLAARSLMAAEESILINRPMALVVTAEGYGFARLEPNGWLNIDDGSPLGFQSWPPGIEHRVVEPAEPAAHGRLVRFDPLGGATPAEIVVNGGGAWWKVSVAPEGEIRVERGEE